MPANGQQYWANMLQPLATNDSYIMSFCTGQDEMGNPVQVPTKSATAAIYDLFCGFNKNETTGLFVWDYFGVSGASGNSYLPAGGSNSFFNPQFSSLYGWRSNSNANYHAMQANLRHAMKHGVQFDFTYTFSKSIDIVSDATLLRAWGGLGGQMINAWTPTAMRAGSDYS